MMRVLQLEIYFKPVLSWSNTQALPQGCLRHRRAPWRTSAPPRTSAATAWPADTCPLLHLWATCRRNDVSALNTCQSRNTTRMTASFRNFLQSIFINWKLHHLNQGTTFRNLNILYCYDVSESDASGYIRESGLMLSSLIWWRSQKLINDHDTSKPLNKP